jgi:DNA-binding CsgD family transcriptional regulator
MGNETAQLVRGAPGPMAAAHQAPPQSPPAPPLALTPRQRTILALRYSDTEPLRPARRRRVAQAVGCSEQRVTILEQHALHRLDALARAVALGVSLPAEQAADWQRFAAVWRRWSTRRRGQLPPAAAEPGAHTE